jgi:hypothetical protein
MCASKCQFLSPVVLSDNLSRKLFLVGCHYIYVLNRHIYVLRSVMWGWSVIRHNQRHFLCFPASWQNGKLQTWPCGRLIFSFSNAKYAVGSIVYHSFTRIFCVLLLSGRQTVSAHIPRYCHISVAWYPCLLSVRYGKLYIILVWFYLSWNHMIIIAENLIYNYLSLKMYARFKYGTSLFLTDIYFGTSHNGCIFVFFKCIILRPKKTLQSTFYRDYI